MGRRAAHGLAGLPLALAVLALAPAAGAQQQPLVVPPVVTVQAPAETPPAPPVQAPPAPPVQAPPEPPVQAPPAPPVQAPPAPPVQAPAETPPGPAPIETSPVPPPAEAPPAQPSPELAPELPPEPSEVAEARLLALAPPQRPRLSLAVGMGATLDPTGFPDGRHLIPAFFGVGGFGDGLVGFDLGAFSSAASGRFPTTEDNPVDRLALDAFGVLRPAARARPADQRYGVRVLRTIGVELGLGFERDGQVVVSGDRWVIHTGARIEFPLTSGQTGELRLRLAMRRAFGLYTPELSKSVSSPTISVGDSTELYAALAVVF